jgi:cell division septation protein DedD
MAFLFDTEEEQQTRKSNRSTAALGHAVGTDTEIALGTRSLLAIFFGLVLICAIFFGLGYSVGRGSGAHAAAQPTPDVATTAPDSRLPKPSPEQLTPVETPPAATDPGDAPTSDSAPASQPGAETRPPAGSPASSSPASSPAASSQTPGKTPVTPQATKPAVLEPAAATTASFMVQVAAVRVPQDAEILVNALKKRGYTAVVRNEPQDQLLHIQLGPFASRVEAMAMRTKLLGDGYNAVVK